MNFRVPVETNIAYWLVDLHFQFIWSCIPCIAMEVLWSFYLHSRMWLWLAWGLICCRRFRKETLLYKRVYQIYWKNVRCFDWALDTELRRIMHLRWWLAYPWKLLLVFVVVERKILLQHLVIISPKMYYNSYWFQMIFNCHYSSTEMWRCWFHKCKTW